MSAALRPVSCPIGVRAPHTPVEVATFLAEIDREAVDDRNFVLTGAQSQAGSEGFVAVGDVQTAQGAAEKQRDRATRGVVHAAEEATFFEAVFAAEGEIDAPVGKIAAQHRRRYYCV